MAQCPYCYPEMLHINFNSIMHDKIKKDTFFSTAEKVLCDKCNKNFYKTNLEPVTVDIPAPPPQKMGLMTFIDCDRQETLDVCATHEKFKELKNKYFTGSTDLARYLPNDKELKERYEDLKKSFNDNYSDRQKLFNIRSVIESYLVYTNDIEEAFNLHREVEKLDIKEELQEVFKNIIKQCVKAIHIKKDVADIIPEKAFKFINIIFTQQFKIPEEIKMLNAKKQAIENELSDLICNF